ncbi:MAG TPA: RsmD family RNA methyltransferase [Sphingobacterium sp.]|nr:RsmD family RNA methyltransferase [Sphingobacterium sp.]
MRVIGGILKGHVLHPPRNLPVRPTTDRSKEALFNILSNQLDFSGLNGLELFAGTGNISLEFLSRGIDSMTAYDIHHGCVRYMKQVAEKLKLDNFYIHKGNAVKLLQAKKNIGEFDVVFADPPFNLPDIVNLPELILEGGLLKEKGIFILEHPKLVQFPDSSYLQDIRKYGESVFRFYVKT